MDRMILNHNQVSSEPATTHLATRLIVVVRESLTSWMHHRASSKGAALAFYTVFSMTPILVLAIAIAGYIS